MQPGVLPLRFGERLCCPVYRTRHGFIRKYSLHSKIGGVFGCAAMTKESWRMQDCSLNSCFHLLRPRLLDYRANSPLTPPKTPLARVLSFPFHRPKSSFFPFHHAWHRARNSLPSLLTARNFHPFLFTMHTTHSNLSSFRFSSSRQPNFKRKFHLPPVLRDRHLI